MWKIADILGSILGFASKNPIVAKMAIFTIFIAVITSALAFIKALVAPYLVTNSLFAVASYFGILDALSLYLTIIVAGFGVKQVLAFMRS
jgi:hypothetical protein